MLRWERKKKKPPAFFGPWNETYGPWRKRPRNSRITGAAFTLGKWGNYDLRVVRDPGELPDALPS